MRAVAVASAAVIGGSSALFGASVAHTDDQLHSYAGKTIRYELTGDAQSVEHVYYETNNGPQQAANVTLPWSDEFAADQSLRTVMLRAQNNGPGSITCRIVVDGSGRGQATSTGGHANITCSE